MSEIVLKELAELLQADGLRSTEDTTGIGRHRLWGSNYCGSATMQEHVIDALSRAMEREMDRRAGISERQNPVTRVAMPAVCEGWSDEYGAGADRRRSVLLKLRFFPADQAQLKALKDAIVDGGADYLKEAELVFDRREDAG